MSVENLSHCFKTNVSPEEQLRAVASVISRLNITGDQPRQFTSVGVLNLPGDVAGKSYTVILESGEVVNFTGEQLSVADTFVLVIQENQPPALEPVRLPGANEVLVQDESSRTEADENKVSQVADALDSNDGEDNQQSAEAIIGQDGEQEEENMEQEDMMPGGDNDQVDHQHEEAKKEEQPAENRAILEHSYSAPVVDVKPEMDIDGAGTMSVEDEGGDEQVDLGIKVKSEEELNMVEPRGLAESIKANTPYIPSIRRSMRIALMVTKKEAESEAENVMVKKEAERPVRQVNNKRGKIKSKPSTALLDEKPFICEFCSYVFTYESIFLRHMRLKHSGSTPFQCTTCKKSFPSRHSLFGHQWVHKSASWGKRKGKGKESKSKGKSTAAKGQSTVKPSSVICKTCSRSFSGQSQLSNHIKTHRVR